MVKEMLHEQFPTPITDNHNSQPESGTPSTRVNNTQAERASTKRTRKTTEERKAEEPEFSKNVPEEDRLPDEVLIKIGKIVNGYQRHRRAPYTFSHNGRLRSEYQRLVNHRSEDCQWTAKEIFRLLS